MMHFVVTNYLCADIFRPLRGAWYLPMGEMELPTNRYPATPRQLVCREGVLELRPLEDGHPTALCLKDDDRWKTSFELFLRRGG